MGIGKHEEAFREIQDHLSRAGDVLYAIKKAHTREDKRVQGQEKTAIEAKIRQITTLQWAIHDLLESLS
jgi:hypothetical protein